MSGRIKPANIRKGANQEQILEDFIKKMPKIELHLHIEGTMEPDLMLELAKRNKMTLYKKDKTPCAYTLPKNANVNKVTAAKLKAEDAAALTKERKFNNLQEFLDLYYQGMSVLKKEEDFEDLTYAYLKKVASQNVKHVEIFFDPQGHTERGVTFDTAITGIDKALKRGEKELGVSSKLIMSFLRHLPEKAPKGEKRDYKDAFETLNEAKPYIEKGLIHGFGLDSSESNFPPRLFKNVFAKARKLYPDLPLMAHAGEEGPADFVRQSLDVLEVDRIDHGNHSLDDDALVDRLARERMGLTVCPLSNLKLCHTLDFDSKPPKKLTSLKDHQLKKMLKRGLLVSINSDDPAYFGGYMNENFIEMANALKLTRDDIIQLARNAIETSFLSPEEKQEETKKLDAYIEKTQVTGRHVNPAKGRARGAHS